MREGETSLEIETETITRSESTWNDLSGRCRACLGLAAINAGAKPLFEGDSPLCEPLRKATRVRLRPDDGGPDLICIKCQEDLATAVAFRDKCEQADRRIKAYLTNKPGDQQLIAVKLETDLINNSVDTDCEDTTVDDYSESICSLRKSKSKKNKSAKKLKKKNPETTRKKQKLSVVEPPPEIFKCSQCDNIFADAKLLKTHMKTHTSSREHTCDQCGKQFKYKDNLRFHKMTHTGERPYSCDLCDKSFNKKDNLAIHRKRHLKERNYNCEQCGSAYYTSYELKIHMRAHTGEKPHACNMCGKSFTAKNNLLIHQRSHTGERPHVCTVCGKQFTSRNILAIHSRIHTGEKPYVCSVCGKRFTANKIAVHMRTHTGEKPHICNLCGKQFSATNVLMIHMRCHTGEKPYECKVCGQFYAHTQSLNKHMRRQHKIVTNPKEQQTNQVDEVNNMKFDECIAPTHPEVYVQTERFISCTPKLVENPLNEKNHIEILIPSNTLDLLPKKEMIKME